MRKKIPFCSNSALVRIKLHFQPDIAAAGGITELKKIADMAETYGVEVVPHSWGTGIAIHAAMHLIGMFSI